MMTLHRALCSIAVGTMMLGVTVPTYAANTPARPTADTRLQNLQDNGFARPGQSDNGVAHGRPAYPGERGLHLGWYKDKPVVAVDDRAERLARHIEVTDVATLSVKRLENTDAFVAWLRSPDGALALSAIDKKGSIGKELAKLDFDELGIAKPAFWDDLVRDLNARPSAKIIAHLDEKLDIDEALDELEDVRFDADREPKPAFWDDLLVWLRDPANAALLEKIDLDDDDLKNPAAFLAALKALELDDTAAPAFWSDFVAWVDEGGAEKVTVAQAATLAREAAKDLSAVAPASANAPASLAPAAAWLNTAEAAEALAPLVANGSVDEPVDVLATLDELDGAPADVTDAAKWLKTDEGGTVLDAAAAADLLHDAADRIAAEVKDPSADVTSLIKWLRSPDAAKLVLSLADDGRLVPITRLTDEDFARAGVERPAFLAAALDELGVKDKGLCPNATNRGAEKNPDVPGHWCPPGMRVGQRDDGLWGRFASFLGLNRLWDDDGRKRGDRDERPAAPAPRIDDDDDDHRAPEIDDDDDDRGGADRGRGSERSNGRGNRD